jgi:hypothetical protein
LPASAFWLTYVAWPAFWVLLGTSFYFRGLGNYGSTLSTFLRPVRQMRLILSGVSLFLVFILS